MDKMPLATWAEIASSLTSFGCSVCLVWLGNVLAIARASVLI